MLENTGRVRFYETLPKRSKYDFLRLDNSFRKSPLRYLYAVQNDGPSIYSHRMGDFHDTIDRPSSRRSNPEQRMIPASSDTAVASLRLIALAKEQFRRASRHRSLVALRSRSPTMRAPRMHTLRTAVVPASPSPMSRSAITSARTALSGPHPVHLSGESIFGSPARRSTQVPMHAACQIFLSGSVRLLTFMASSTHPNDEPKWPSISCSCHA
jgi:hypothetical protein